MEQTSTAEQLAREIAREATFLPERWRLWLFERLREDFAAFDREQHEIDRLNQRMSQAVAALDRVARHLDLDGLPRLDLTMRQFDAASERVRDGWTARQIADTMRGSWRLAKSVAFDGAILPVTAEQHAKQRQRQARKRREAAFGLSAVQDWLDARPTKRRREDYDCWARKQPLKPGQKPLPLAKTIQSRWRQPWKEIVQAAGEGRTPGEQRTTASEPTTPLSQSELPTQGKSYVLDARLRSRRIKEARQAHGWSLPELAQKAGLDSSNVAKIERNEIGNPSFETVVKLAQTLGLSLDDFATAD